MEIDEVRRVLIVGAGTMGRGPQLRANADVLGAWVDRGELGVKTAGLLHVPRSGQRPGFADGEG